MPDYNSYYAKHVVRYRAWLPAIKSLLPESGHKILKYFTLCAKDAIDVFMLEKTGILRRNKNGSLGNIVICEREMRDAAEIRRLVRPPVKDAIIVGELGRILAFQDTQDTQDLQGYEDDERLRSMEQRKLFNTKRKHHQLLRFFPFDIVNFDTTGNMLNPDDEENILLLDGFKKIFEFQRGTHEFLLIVTTPLGSVHRETEIDFSGDIATNANRHPEVRDALLSSCGTVDFAHIEEHKRTMIGFVKSIIIPCTRNNGWRAVHQRIDVYESSSPNWMMSVVVKLTSGACRSLDAHIPDLVNVIRTMPIKTDYTSAKNDRRVVRDLHAIIEYREQVRRSFRL